MRVVRREEADGEIIDSSSAETIDRGHVYFTIKVGNKEFTFEEFDNYFYKRILLIEKL